MNKSKFLKKSLAALLAILMVAAMIPMSAFAAEADKILVGGEEAALFAYDLYRMYTAPL